MHQIESHVYWLGQKFKIPVGSTLIGGGGMRTVATGTLLGIHGSHRHDRRTTVHAAPGGLAIRF